MSTVEAKVFPIRQRTRAIASLARGVVIIAGLCLVCTAAASGHYLLSEDKHGDRQMVLRLIEQLSP